MWLALTCARIKAKDCLELGIASHIVPNRRLTELQEALEETPAAVEETLADFASEPGARSGR